MSMCDICMRTPHAHNCPNATREVAGRCEWCGAELEKGDEYYKDGSNLLFCSTECALDYYMIQKVVEED